MCKPAIGGEEFLSLDAGAEARGGCLALACRDCPWEEVIGKGKTADVLRVRAGTVRNVNGKGRTILPHEKCNGGIGVFSDSNVGRYRVGNQSLSFDQALTRATSYALRTL